MEMFKNPIILSLVAGILTYIIMMWISPTIVEKDKKKDRKNKNKNKNNKSGFTETNVLLSVAVSLGVWFLSHMYLKKSGDESDNGSQNNDGIIDTSSVSLENNVIDIKRGLKGAGGVINSLSSDVTRSYNLLGTGLEMPKRKLPSVLIDTM